MLKTITCPRCSGLKVLKIKDFHGDARSTPSIETLHCKYCSGKGTIKISVDKNTK